MNNNFTQKLKWLRSEVTALKQAHKYGLNSAGFYLDSALVYFPSTLSYVDIRVVITFDTKKNVLPMFIWSVGGINNFYGQTWDQNAKQVRMSYSVLGILGSSSISVTSTKPIKQIVLEVI